MHICLALKQVFKKPPFSFQTSYPCHFQLAYNLITNKEINFYKNWCSRIRVKRNLVQNFTKADFEWMPIPHQKALSLLAECGGLNREVYNYLGQGTINHT